VANRIVLRTDAGEILGRFKTVNDARRHAADPGKGRRGDVLVIQTVDGVVLARWWPLIAYKGGCS